MIEILGIQVEAYFILPVIIFMAVGAYRIIRPFILRANALKIRLRDKKRFAIVHHKNGKHVYLRQKGIITDFGTLCGESFWFDAKAETFNLSNVTCGKCKNLIDTI